MTFSGKEIYYWRNKGECDFILRGKTTEAIQVCYNLEETKDREIKSLLEAMYKFRIRSGIIITEDYENEEKVKGKIIKFIPLWKWLLTN